MFAKPFHSLIGEPWLALNRLLTFHTLSRQLRKCAGRPHYDPVPGSILYVAASSLPYHTTGYTTRTHEVISALRATGASVHVHTRPGYPWDRSDRACDATSAETLVGDVPYRHVRDPSNRRPVLQYAAQAAPVLAILARHQRVAVIHAASNHVNALPALLAARQLGVPFHYEMRGLWELTRSSRMPGYEGSQGYKQGLQLEGLVARHADRLFVISQQLGRYAREHWGVPEERMALLPNCIDPGRIVPGNPGQVDAESIGYAGALIVYEGLDTLIDAIDLLRRSGRSVRLDIVGDGEARGQLEAQVARLGLADRIRFHGRVAPEAARQVIARSALVCIPRRPFKVCEMVPPIKLIEAMAMAKPVVVPDLPVFRDELGDNPAGWYFRAGDAGDLARVLGAALASGAALAAVGARARTHAITQRRWQDYVCNMLPVRAG
ncbi:MAG: glycosyltransferase [Rhodocyclaceae bacterium]|nr:glycosyltransferase [Rhodocyclaceae bacterium]